MTTLLRPLDCPRCGAPLPEDAIGASVTTCPFCESTLAVEPGVVFAAAFARAAKALDDEAKAMANVVRVGDVPYAVEGRLARGESSDVFLARRAHRVTERVVIKVLRALADADLMAREAATLRALQSSTVRGSPYFSRLIPQLVQESHVVDDDRTRRPALVLRQLSGFVPTFVDARATYAEGVDPRAAVWMWRRVLETLDWVHAGGRVHGAVLPQHLVLHARDHGVMLVGWSCAQRVGEPLVGASKEHRDFHPDDVWEGAPLHTRTDVAMSARCIAWVLGGDARTGNVPSSVPSPLAQIIRAHADGSASTDAATLREIVGEAAKQAFGPPTYVPFHL